MIFFLYCLIIYYIYQQHSDTSNSTSSLNTENNVANISRSGIVPVGKLFKQWISSNLAVDYYSFFLLLSTFTFFVEWHCQSALQYEFKFNLVLGHVLQKKKSKRILQNTKEKSFIHPDCTWYKATLNKARLLHLTKQLSWVNTLSFYLTLIPGNTNSGLFYVIFIFSENCPPYQTKDLHFPSE